MQFPRSFLIALLIALPLYLFSTFTHDLWRPAEAREAGIARDMIESGDWAATHLNGKLFLEKPPLYTWMLALPLQWFGYSDWLVRISVFLFTAGTLALTFAFAKKRLGHIGAQAATASLASMWLFLEVNHGAMVDNGLMFFVALAMLAFDRLSDKTAKALPWALLFFAALGLSFLCKGGVGPVLVGTACGCFIMSGKHRHLLMRLHIPAGMLVFGLVVAAWLIPLWLRGGDEYFRVFFVENHLKRFTGAVGPQRDGFSIKYIPYYIPYLFQTPAPWTLLIPFGAKLAWTRRQAGGEEARNLWDIVFWWITGMLFVLSMAGSKDNQYLLPLLPPLAVFAGLFVEQTWKNLPIPRLARPALWLFGVSACMVVSALPLLPWLMRGKFTVPALALSIATALAGAWTLRALARGNARVFWMRLAGLTILAGIFLGLYAEPELNREKSGRPLFAALDRLVPRDAAFYGYDLNENTEGMFVFYGWRPKLNIKSRASAQSLGSNQNPIYLALMSKASHHETAEALVLTNDWQLIEKVEAGSRFYWILANRAATHKR